MEEAFYESPVLRRFAGVDLGVAAAPDETTILRFRHLLEQHDLCGEMLMTVNRYLETKGIRITTGTKVRYRGIWKNHQWLCAAFALVNLYQHRNRLVPQRA